MTPPHSDTHFVVFVPGYNVERFIERALESLERLDYPNFEVLLIDDASTDATGTVMDEFAKNGRVPFCSVFHNTENLKMPRNLWLLKEWGSADDVFFLLDADDFLPNERVLTVLDAEYGPHPELWVTYGSFLHWPDPYAGTNQAVPYPPTVLKNRSFRQHQTACYNHPLTFRRHLLERLDEGDLQDDDGQWFRAAYDHVLMMPMLEMAAPRHIKWIPQFLYVYNDENPASEVQACLEEVERTHTVVNERPKKPSSPDAVTEKWAS